MKRKNTSTTDERLAPQWSKKLDFTEKQHLRIAKINFSALLFPSPLCQEQEEEEGVITRRLFISLNVDSAVCVCV